ncbi:hypothetical protein AGMMS50293_02790 [Spirochaetia bacterium]|nr:hypothetical protein AGMMS50293_02790 [Spirochaetia bacterium]
MLALVAAIIFLIYKNRIKIFFVINIIILFALLGISVVHSISILKEFNQFTIMRNSTEESKATLSPIFNFSKEGKNVIVIMLDRAISSFVPEIFSEIPELYNQFSGFVYYPNTVSFNIQTLMGAPPLFGGYEYTPKEINKRSDEPLVKKHNESLLLMPVIFSSNNFSVTVTDPPWANYSWIPDIRIYKNYPDIKVYNTIRSYTDTWLNKNNFSKLQLKSKILKRNFIWFSLFKSAPLALRYAIYNSGDWWSTDKMTIDFRQILNNYAVLDFLPILTDTNTDKKNTFTLMQNEMTHEPAFLQAPGYIPVPAVTNKGNSKFANISNYPSNAAALRLLGIWFDHLASMGVYNNTRIIIVADHSAGIDTGAFADAPTLPFNREALNPLLMVKDFDANFPLKTDATFMTNADVPTLAFKDIIDDPVNPFTGNPVTDTMKKYPLLITTSGKWMPFAHHTNTFIINNDEWYSVHDNIFDAQNWQKVE